MKKDEEILLKTSLEILHIRKASEIVASVLAEVENIIREGTSLKEIDSFCLDIIKKSGAESAIRGFRGFPGNVCISLNNVAAHGIPSDIKLQNGDVVTVDCAVVKNGWHGDAAKTYGVGKLSMSAQRIIRASEEALAAGISKAKAGNRIGDIGNAVEAVAEKHRCSVFHNFVGHGIGRGIHEDPKIYHFGEAGVGQPIVPGMVFTIEPILSLGEAETKTLADGWSLVTVDNSLTAQFEHTLAVFSDRTEILSDL